MKTSGLNPYLPFWETVPDGEPHVFGDRVYIYGSHDRLGGTSFCEEDYVCWSAPVEEPGVWTCEGVIYKKMQDPLNGAPYGKKLPGIGMPLGTEENPHLLYAPDVAQGPDGRYYLYYALDFVNVISVAVCDTPAGFRAQGGRYNSRRGAMVRSGHSLGGKRELSLLWIRAGPEISGDGACDISGGHDGEAGTGHAYHHQRAEVCGKWYRYGKGDFL